MEENKAKREKEWKKDWEVCARVCVCVVLFGVCMQCECLPLPPENRSFHIRDISLKICCFYIIII